MVLSLTATLKLEDFFYLSLNSIKFCFSQAQREFALNQLDSLIISQFRVLIRKSVSLCEMNKFVSSAKRLTRGVGHWGLLYCGTGQFFVRFFGNFNFEMQYCSVLVTCGMRFFSISDVISKTILLIPSLFQFPI